MSNLVRILLVEDNPGDADLIVELLPRNGTTLFEVECVARLSEAFECIGENRFDIILLDLGLPDSNGLDTLRAMRCRAAQFPIVVLTGNKDEQVALTSIQEGVQDFLVKGEIDTNLLARSIKYAIERKRAEEKLRASESKFRQLYESMMNAYGRVDMSGRIVDFNTAFMNLLGYNGEDLRRLTFVDITPPRWHSVESRIVDQQVMARGYSDLYEKEYQRKDGTLVPVEIRTTLIKDETGRPSGMYAIISDITERRKLEKQLSQAQKMEAIGTLAGGIAHHFNNQLTSVMGNLEMAMFKLPLAAAIRNNLDKAMQAAKRAAEVSGLILAYLGQIPCIREPLDFSEACRRSFPMLLATVSKELVLETDLPSPGPVVSANENMIQKLLINLVTNAWEAVGNGRGAIHLTVKTVSLTDIPTAHHFPFDWEPRDNSYACLEVADAGCGIAAEDIEKLFDPFFSTKFPGRGLGLAQALGIVRVHKGAVTVESEPGRGSVFRVFLPLSEEEAPPAGGQKRPRHRRLNG